MGAGTVVRDQNGVVRQSDDDALAEHPADGVFDRLAGLLVDDVEHVGQACRSRRRSTSR